MGEKKNLKIEDFECESLPIFKRNNYFYGKLLTASDFKAEQKYFVNKQRLINRLIHGVGVVCGLEVTEEKDEEGQNSKIAIARGIALDYCGREIILPDKLLIDLNEFSNFLENGSNEVYVVIKYNACGDEKSVVPQVLESSSCDENCCYSKIKETYIVDIITNPHQINEDNADDFCSEWFKFIESEGEKDDFHLKKCSLPEEKKDQGIVLSKIKVTKENDTISIHAIDHLLKFDEEIKRKNVYSNDLLYRLIKCLEKRKREDLPKISSYNWIHNKEYTAKRSDSFKEALQFFDFFKQYEIVFTKDMNEKTISHKTLNLSLIGYLYREQDEKNEYAEAIIQKMEVPFQFEKSPINRTTKLKPSFPVVTFVLIAGTVFGAQQKLKEAFPNIGFRVVIKLKGDFIQDTTGKCLDANHLRGEKPSPEKASGNNCEGGIFESWFDLRIPQKNIRYILKLISDAGSMTPDKITNITKFPKILTVATLDGLVMDKKLININGVYYSAFSKDAITIVADDTINPEMRERFVEEIKDSLIKAEIDPNLVKIIDSNELTSDRMKTGDTIILAKKEISEELKTKLIVQPTKTAFTESKGTIEMNKDEETGARVFILGAKNSSILSKIVNNFKESQRVTK